jgi:hypothetical protein
LHTLLICIKVKLGSERDFLILNVRSKTGAGENPSLTPILHDPNFTGLFRESFHHALRAADRAVVFSAPGKAV